MKNKDKGFTLIELLVVVAIIGILAAVGTVAYTGYTASAKKNAAQTMHSQAAKYLAAEIQKCTLNSGGTAMEGNIDCDGTDGGTDDPTGTNYATHYVTVANVKNPHTPTAVGAVTATAAPAAKDIIVGQLYLVVDGDEINLLMTAADGETQLDITVTVE